MSSAVWQTPCYDFYCSIIMTSCDLTFARFIVDKVENEIGYFLMMEGRA